MRRRFTGTASIPAVDYTREELLYLQRNPRSHRVYGYGPVEQVLVTVNILIRRALHQLEYYREGSQPDAFVGLPKEWDQEQILAFQRHFDGMLSGHAGMRRRVRFMPGDFSYRETKAPLLKDAYDEFLARIICFVFSVSPDVFTGHMNRATAQVSQGRAVEEGLVPLKRFVCEMMNRVIVEEFGSAELEFVWVDGNVQDPKDAAQVNVAYVGAGILTVDEVRAGLGLEALAKGAAWVGKRAASVANKFNPYHVPAGNPDGGQFATPSEAGGGSGGMFSLFGDVLGGEDDDGYVEGDDSDTEDAEEDEKDAIDKVRNGVDTAYGEMKPVNTNPVNGPFVNQANIFIGGFGDSSISGAVEESKTLKESIGNNYYFTYTEGDKVAALIDALPDSTTINVIGHSYGGDTAAKVIANSANEGRIDTLVTIDPVSWFPPDLKAISSHAEQWVNVNAVGNGNGAFSGVANGNVVAGIGSAWNSAPKGIADMYIEANYPHAYFDSMMREHVSNNQPPPQEIINTGIKIKNEKH